MKTLVLAATAGLIASWTLASAKAEPLKNFDKRTDAVSAGRSLSAPGRQQAAARLKQAIPDVKISENRVLGTPAHIASTSGFLTGPQGKGKGLSGAALAAVPENDPHRVIKAFINEHAALFQNDARMLENAVVQRDQVTAHNGLRTTVWQQTLEGIPVFDGVLIGHVTRNGELASISSLFVPDAARAAEAGTPGRQALLSKPAVAPAAAIAAAAADINVAGVSETSVVFTDAPAGAGKRQHGEADGLIGNVAVELVWLPTSADSLRLCWRVLLGNRTTMEHYLVLVDAETGEVMVRRSLTSHASPVAYNVYTSDSPSPFTPGPPTPSGEQGEFVGRELVTCVALDTNASPAGWIPDSGRTTSGNNAIAFLDRDFSESPDRPLPQATGTTNRTFDFEMDLELDPYEYADAAIVQMFYRMNWYHDRLYQLGFTEEFGNFQNNNFGRGGYGGDAIVGLVQCGADYAEDYGIANNAMFSTPPDGYPGYCYMFVWIDVDPWRDGALDSEIVCHELTHGTSGRLVGGGVGISALQSGGLGEGWSDFYPLSLLSEPEDNIGGTYAAGGYATYHLYSFFEQNYYFGIRRYPYSTDMSKNPLTFKDIDPSRYDPHPGIPISPIFGGGDPSEVHNSGEVWCVVLWEMRANLVDKWGWEIGNELALLLVTDGMKLCPPNPTFLEARDAIILADRIDTTGDNYPELWFAFAKRGMGYDAVCPPSDTTMGVLESYALPPDLGSPDGVMEIRMNPSNGDALFVGDTNLVTIRVSDLFPITNAAIDATIAGSTNLPFRNDGVAPDVMANNGVYSSTLKSPSTAGMLSINSVISSTGKETVTNQVTYYIIAPPPNDNFASAVKVGSGGTNCLTSNGRATKELSEPAHADVSSSTASLWWNYTPAIDGGVLVDAGGSKYRTIVAVYTNKTLGTLQAVKSAVGSADRPGAYVTFNAKAGVTYHIALAGYDPRSVGTLNLNIVPGAQVDTNPPVVTVTSPVDGLIVTTNRILVSGTAVDPSPNPSGILGITLGVSSAANPAPLEFPVRIGSSLTGPTSTNWSSFVGLNPGQNTIQVSATDFVGNRSVPVEVSVTYRPLDPPNDFFVSALVLTNPAGLSVVNNNNATKEPGEPNHAGTVGGKSVWWKYTAPADGVLTLSTVNSTFDTVLAMYTGSAVGGLTPVASNDDGGDQPGYSRIDQAVRSGQTYRIAVDGYDGLSGVAYLTNSFVSAPVFHVEVTSTAGGQTVPVTAEVASNTPVVLAAYPAANYTFDMWDGSIISLDNPVTVLVTGNLNITARFRPVPCTDGFETGDLSHLEWSGAGNKPWVVQSSQVAAGSFAAKSGTISHSQSSALILAADFRAGPVSFDYRVSSEASFDFLRFYIDGILQQSWSGEVGWAGYACTISAGHHILEWRYSKDPTGSSGLDAAFIDNVNAPVVVGLDETSAADLEIFRELDGGIFLNVTGQVNQQYIIQISSDLKTWQNVSTNIAVDGFVRIPDAAAGSGTRFYRAIAAP